ncbi:MAG TPA: class I SAM-dependent methyltransferase [Pyrinomonadaceae bacterium]|nr:class I SAM-dependent methyltransferase [Pyrinomonadaceae bacterium]
MIDTVDLKQKVKAHWEHEVCGSRNASASLPDRRDFYNQIDKTRYEQDYMIGEFAQFEQARGKKVLEIGLGTGADFSRWARAEAIAYGRDLTEASVRMVKERLALDDLTADVAVGDAENLKEFEDDFFDIYYSWGVLHHTPNPEKAFAEAYRVLKPGGTLKIMLYHYPSVSALLIWLLYGPLRLNMTGPRECYAKNVESIGTKIYTAKQAKEQLGKYFKKESITTRTYLGPGDLLNHNFSEKYRAAHWRLITALYPTWFIKHVVGHRFGTVLTITATK